MINILEINNFLKNIDKNSLLIDARSPKEFQESHIKDALNLYVLDDSQRDMVGTLYKESPFNAKMLGASLINQNIAKYLQNELKSFTPKTKIFIYCAKGGQRSQSFGIVLANIGFRVYKLKGGYKAYRNYILNYLDTFEYNSFVILDGPTGSGKSELIREFENSIDLEKTANHYGSSFGKINGPQPSTKQFQNSIYDELKRVEKFKTVLVEGESKKIGDLHIPDKLYQKMLEAPRIRIKSSLQDRINRIVKDYQDIDAPFFEKAIKKITPYIEKKYIQDLKDKFYKEDYQSCAEILLTKYYDKVYRQRKDCIATVTYKTIKNAKEEIKKIISSLYQ